MIFSKKFTRVIKQAYKKKDTQDCTDPKKLDN
nr:MAG TPA: hypothetical protein [Caudoviricetes sp.]